MQRKLKPIISGNRQKLKTYALDLSSYEERHHRLTIIVDKFKEKTEVMRFNL